MTKPKTPKFEKGFNHYVPQFWLRRFRDAKRQLWKREKGKIERTSMKRVMGEFWLYTTYDERFQPSDELEDKLSVIEGSIDQLFSDLSNSSAIPTDQQWVELCLWLGLTACRHPRAMARGHTLGRDYVYDLADVSSHSDEREFTQYIRSRFGVDVPSGTYDALRRMGDEALLEEAAKIDKLSPQDSRLPATDALKGALNVARQILGMDLFLLDSVPGSEFVLGDTPVPLAELGGGFGTPLTSKLAFVALPPTAVPMSVRDAADASIVSQVNQDQARRAAGIIVGPSKAVLSAL